MSGFEGDVRDLSKVPEGALKVTQAGRVGGSTRCPYHSSRSPAESSPGGWKGTHRRAVQVGQWFLRVLLLMELIQLLVGSLQPPLVFNATCYSLN